MPEVFIALENAASAFGIKNRNTAIPGQKAKKTDKKTDQKYEARMKIAERLDWQPDQDQTEGKADQNIHFIAKMAAQKHNYSLGVAGSLPSLFKRLAAEVSRGKSKFDTLIFLGHGNAGAMTTGLGHTPTDRLTKKDEQILRIDKRMINVKDSGHWKDTFAEHASSLGVDQNDVFHVLFMGCATGNMSETSYRILPQVVAQSLAGLLERNVICYGSSKLIENAEMTAAIGQVGSITQGAATDGGLSGTSPLTTKVKLRWYRENYA